MRQTRNKNVYSCERNLLYLLLITSYDCYSSFPHVNKIHTNKRSWSARSRSEIFEPTSHLVSGFTGFIAEHSKKNTFFLLFRRGWKVWRSLLLLGFKCFFLAVNKQRRLIGDVVGLQCCHLRCSYSYEAEADSRKV